MDWYLKVFKQYADFSGRARRKEYWMFMFFHIMALTIAALLDYVLGISFNNGYYGWIYLAYGLFTMVPALAVSVRRLHDRGLSGWWYFIGIIPFFGAIGLFVLMCLDGEVKRNKWGDNPKGIGNYNSINQIGTE